MPLPEFNSWISSLDLSSPSALETTVDTVCEGIDDKLNPKNDIEYVKVMQSHLLLEVWSQIRIFMLEQYQKMQFVSSSTISEIHAPHPNQMHTNWKHHKKGDFQGQSFGGTLKFSTDCNKSLQIPHHSYLLLLWKSKENESLSDIQFAEENEQKVIDDESKSRKKKAFPPHILLKVKSLKSKIKYLMHWDIKLDLNQETHRKLTSILKEQQKQQHKLHVIPIKNLIYLQRDYDAIRNVNTMPLSSYIMGQQYLIKQKHNNKAYDLFNKYIKHNNFYKYCTKILNKSQLNALKDSLIKPLTLIHGPPGTGKTKYTLLPILKCAYLGLLQYSNEMNKRIVFNEINYTNNNNLLKQIESKWFTPRIGIFAGSNQAIDEIILFMLNDTENTYNDLNFTRMGNIFNMNEIVANNNDINMNYKIQYYLSLKWKWNENSKRYTEVYGYKNNIHSTLMQIQKGLNEIEKQIHCILTKNNLNKDKIWPKMYELIEQCFSLKLTAKCLNKVEKARFSNQAQRELLPILMNHCKVLFSTANYLGRCKQSEMFDFAIFDECCQMRETETLIALQYCNRAVMIGDTKQLQATFLYHGKYRDLLLNSMFNRLEKYIKPIMLNEQYRMNEEISLFPSNFFYDGKLLNAINIKNGEKNKLFHSDESGYFKPYLFFNVVGYEEKQSNSIVNIQEINCLQNLLKYFLSNKDYASEIENIGIITPYLAHKKEIQIQLNKLIELNRNLNIECVTVDEFQGSERDIIILSCVRSNETKNIGFLTDVCRLNVAITRAKYGLWIIGNADCLQCDLTWKSLIDDAKDRNLFVSVP